MLNAFDTIWLDQLQDNSSFLRRIETKFLVNRKKLNDLLEAFQENYNILKIWENSIFTYNTIYFDTPNLKNYYQHHQGKRLRKKVRTRLYEDSNSCFFEVKLKHKTNTIKKRQKINLTAHGSLDNSMLDFANKYSHELYSELLTTDKQASLQTRYKRITLVSKNFDERITFDFDFQFCNLRVEKEVSTGFLSSQEWQYCENRSKLDCFASSQWQKQTQWQNVFEEKKMMIIEIKSNKENSEWKKKLKKKGFLPVSYGCSKYCIWLNFLNLVSKWNKFKPVLRAIGKL